MGGVWAGKRGARFLFKRLLQRIDDRLHIIAQHIDVGGNTRAGVAERIGIEIGDDLHAGFVGQGLSNFIGAERMRLRPER